MNLRNNLIIAFSVGIIVTLVLGLVPYPMGSFIGSQKWGLPFYWLSRAVYPGATITIIWLSLIIDLIIWAFVIFLIIRFIDFLVKYRLS